MIEAFVDEDFATKEGFKFAVEAGHRLVVTTTEPHPLGLLPAGGHFTGTLLVKNWRQSRWNFSPFDDGPFRDGVGIPDWKVKAEVSDGVVVRVY
jgi:hypothetical protein